MPDVVNLIIWVFGGVIGGMAAGELRKGDYDLGLGNILTGLIGGVVGPLILQTLIPALRGIDFGPIIGQLIVAVASGGHSNAYRRRCADLASKALMRC